LNLVWCSIEEARAIEEGKIAAGELDPKEAARLRALADVEAAADGKNVSRFM
jgi:hypothetical protein